MNQHQTPWVTALLAGFALALTSTPVRGGEVVLPICEPPVDGSPVLKEAGGFEVTQAEWDAELLGVPARARPRYETDKAKQDLTDRVLLNKALFEEARKAGVVDDPVVQRSARMAAEKAFIQAFFSEIEKGAATDEKVKAYYEENLERYSRPMVRLRHILVKEESEALSLKEQIDGGADFADLATEHSLDRASKAKGGELTWATKDRYVKPFAEAAFDLEVGEVSVPVQTQYGYHVIKLLERRDLQPLAEVRPGIERVLVRDAVRDFRNGVKEELGIGAASGSRLRPSD